MLFIPPATSTCVEGASLLIFRPLSRTIAKPCENLLVALLHKMVPPRLPRRICSSAVVRVIFPKFRFHFCLLVAANGITVGKLTRCMVWFCHVCIQHESILCSCDRGRLVSVAGRCSVARCALVIAGNRCVPTPDCDYHLTFMS